MNKTVRTVWITIRTASQTVWIRPVARIQFVKIQNIAQALQKFLIHKKLKGESALRYETIT